MGLRVLVAEDNEFVGLQYRKVFEKHQHTITIVKDGETCLHAYKKALEGDKSRSEPYDVVLLDFVMPGKNGVRVAKEILELKPNQKIIFVSAFGNGILDDAVNILKDAVEIMQKPFSLEFLIKKIENVYALKNTH
jgi:two-component system cell cycle response regulator CpdR